MPFLDESVTDSTHEEVPTFYQGGFQTKKTVIQISNEEETDVRYWSQLLANRKSNQLAVVS